MGRHLLAAGVLAADTALMAAGHRGWALLAYAGAVALVIALGYRRPVTAFVLALALAALTGGAFVLLLWAAYQAGRAARSRVDGAVVVGAALGGLGVRLATVPVSPRAFTNFVVTSAVFVALPLLVGRYLAQHERLVSALDRHNRQLAEEERLRERLRIARDMHDSIGRRLSLVAVRAAALEVGTPAAAPIGAAVRDAMAELHELVGALRADDPGLDAIPALVTQFQAAGVPVTVREEGVRRPLSAPAAHAAYRTVEEGLTNAAKHAPGQPVAVHVTWEPDAVLVAVANPLPDAVPAPRGTGHGLAGLDERLRAAGGLLDHRRSGGGYRLSAMLPTGPPDSTPADRPLRTVGIGFAIAVLMFVLLPAAMLLGVG
jgi:signal transduction histidine kinase